ncbi:quinate 5-dehydrogenase [bacterium]|nr:MAG: quinate 5-dehydrogenase [bacterium]
MAEVELKDTLRVVSVSLGSPSRDHVAKATLLGRAWELERRGTGGDLNQATELIRELDGKVAAIGLGGIDLWLVAGGVRYPVKDAQKLARAAKNTPVVDGSGLKDTLERAALASLEQDGLIKFKGKKVGLTCAVDRFGMAEEFVKLGADVTFGDFLFILSLPIPLKTLRSVRRLARLILPIVGRLPFTMLYPTGDKQTQILDKKLQRRFFEDNEIIAGDFLLIRRYLPASLKGKTIVTNTVTSKDVELLRERGLERLITTTPEFDGRSFGTNVMEGIFAALGDKSPADYKKRLEQLAWKPRVLDLQKSPLESNQ